MDEQLMLKFEGTEEACCTIVNEEGQKDGSEVLLYRNRVLQLQRKWKFN